MASITSLNRDVYWGTIRFRMLSNCGFTLLEVMAAVSIAALGLITIMQLFAMGLKTSKKTEQQTIAVLYAKNLMGQILAQNTLEEGITSGHFDDEYSWEEEVVYYEMPKAGLPAHIIEKEIEPVVDTYIVMVRIYHVSREGPVMEIETLKTVVHKDQP